MNNRGQFFLVAAFVIIVIIFSLGETYVNATAPKQDNQPLIVSSELKKEARYLIDQSVIQDNTDTHIDNSLKTLSAAYSSNYPDVNITIIHGRSSSMEYEKFFGGAIGSKNPSSDNFQQDSDEVSLTSNNNVYSFNLTEGYNFFVISEKTNGDEIVISKK